MPIHYYVTLANGQNSHISMCIKTTVGSENAQWEELPDSPNLCDAAIELLTPNLGVQFYIYTVD